MLRAGLSGRGWLAALLEWLGEGQRGKLRHRADVRSRAGGGVQAFGGGAGGGGLGGVLLGLAQLGDRLGERGQPGDAARSGSAPGLW